MTEQERIAEAKGNPDGWRLWGPYLAERAWGTVREDYSEDGSAWDYFPHDFARSKAYRWNEDGLAGISDIRQFLCFSVALWNGKDAILKERPFGLTGPQGNHGEDVKEYYFYLDATPTQSYLKYLYKYPQGAFPYQDLVDTNGRRGKFEPEYELLDTGAFAKNRYFDVFVEYAKATPEDICIKITVHNRGPEDAPLHVLPTLWFRNTWAWGYDATRPVIRARNENGASVMQATHRRIGDYFLIADGSPQMLFTENDTNRERVYGSPNPAPYAKDGFNDFVVDGKKSAVNEVQTGTKAAFHYAETIAAGGSHTFKLRLTTPPHDDPQAALGASHDAVFSTRIKEADAFYETLAPAGLSDDAKSVQRQAYAGLIWSKQFYSYDVLTWLNGDPAYPPPPKARWDGRNCDWQHVSCADILSMPDAWEYPWFAAWDLAFHMIPFAQIDPDFAKHQLLLLCREWYMHPNGQLPAYEWAFGDVNPPVHAWAALRVYQIEKKNRNIGAGKPGDVDFLERIFHKLLINFTWWVNRKDAQNNNIFEGGFLGLDNIGVFDRSAPLPTGGFIEQADGTAWMAFFCLNMLSIAIELSAFDPTYQDVATKFAEHYIYIAHALTTMGDQNTDLWDDDDGFFYDALLLPDGSQMRLKVRSIVGLIPLLAVEAFDTEVLMRVPDFHRRISWFLEHRPHLSNGVAHLTQQMGMNMGGQDNMGSGEDRVLFSIVSPQRLRRVLEKMLDENEFLSGHGVRALSKFHKNNPYVLHVKGREYRVDYAPAESESGLFGGNSNWRGPVWFPINFLLAEALVKYGKVFGPTFTVEFPTGSGQQITLREVATILERRLISIFTKDKQGRRPVYGSTEVFQTDPHWRDLILFNEYFNGDDGAGLGANHQTGWTALVAKLISESGE